jgi:hypothetical protein
MKEPKRIPINPETPTHKDVKRIPMPYKAEWDITGQDNDDIYTPLDLDKVNKLLDESNEDHSKNN